MIEVNVSPDVNVNDIVKSIVGQFEKIKKQDEENRKEIELENISRTARGIPPRDYIQGF